MSTYSKFTSSMKPLNTTTSSLRFSKVKNFLIFFSSISFFILRQDKLTEAEGAAILKEVLGALNYTHSQKIAHRDLKPENILIKKQNEKYKVKIIDWGLSTLMGDGKANRVCGTPEYVAPEVLKGNYSIPCDMWSVGAITYVMLTGDMPFEGKNTKDTI